MQDQLQGGELVKKFVDTLSCDKKSQIQSYINQIKQLMFIQYQENCKRETKKEISDWYKPVFDQMQTKEGQIQSPKGAQSLKKMGP